MRTLRYSLQQFIYTISGAIMLTTRLTVPSVPKRQSRYSNGLTSRMKKNAVLHAIRVHDVGTTPEDRTTLESKILYDADKIDTLGVVGVLRYIRHFYGKKPIDYMLDGIDARWAGLALPETRNMALQDYKYFKDYFAQLKEELGADA
jgi:hypothetical protein